MSRGELEPALWGASAAVLDGRGRAVAVLSVWGTESRVRERGLARIGTATLAAARELGALIAA